MTKIRLITINITLFKMFHNFLILIKSGKVLKVFRNTLLRYEHTYTLLNDPS